jgi:hypothetical protein
VYEQAFRDDNLKRPAPVPGGPACCSGHCSFQLVKAITKFGFTMNISQTIETRVFVGPSLFSGHPVVSLTIPDSLDTEIQESVVDTLLGPTPAWSYTRSLSSHGGTLKCSEVTLALSRALLAAGGTPELTVNMLTDIDHQAVIIARYYDPLASLTALQASIDLAREISRNSQSLMNNDRAITRFVAQKITELSAYAPDGIAHSLIRMAENKNIPFRVFTGAPGVWLFGQGARGVQFFEAVTSDNGLPGITLAGSKAYTNNIIRSLGYPSTRFGLTNELTRGKNIAEAVGYPVVVKPVDGGKGSGVTANITGHTEFEQAFAKAVAISARGVLVENHVAGDDIRIAIFGGRFAWATKRIP